MLRNFIPFCILVVFVSILVLLNKCGLPHTKTECTEESYQEQLKAAESNTLDTLVFKTKPEAILQARLDSALKALKTHQIVSKIVYRTLYQKSVQKESEFHSGIVSCDTVILAKDKVIAAGEERVLQYDSLLMIGGELIASKNRELGFQAVAITDLSGLLNHAAKEVKSKGKQIKHKNKLLKISGGIIAALIGFVIVK